MSELNALSLFAGIGGLELGLERAGMTTVGHYLLAYSASNDGRGPHESAAPWPIEFEPRGSGWEHSRSHWVSEPALDRVAHGVPRRMVFAPLHALGNAVVPQIAEHIGRQLTGRVVAA